MWGFDFIIISKCLNKENPGQNFRIYKNIYLKSKAQHPNFQLFEQYTGSLKHCIKYWTIKNGRNFKVYFLQLEMPQCAGYGSVS